ncbi:MAG TPA: D-alanyl-D-alanine carboxypeptidase/D-alanyl-D-alanine-endopeptidase [Gemmatimonadaceae bacterium]|nr:D-alanyl-D-alanine carboxypeptidase/D-alanyl-D-alanine-endopeptidase [Gemmatimonadaceae bacterium]
MRIARSAAVGAAVLAALGCASSGVRTAPAGAPEAGPPTMPASASIGARAALNALRAEIDSMADAPEFRNAYWGILIVDAESGDTLYSRNAGKLFMPASNMKLVTGSVALATLGPDFRFETAFAARGPIRDSVLDGDLLVYGRGDPTLSDHRYAGDAMAPLRDIADSLASRGIRRITGQLLSGDDAFPDADLGFGWSWDDLSSDYSAGVDELFFNEGFANIIVHGARRAGDPAAVTVAPAPSYPVVISHVMTGETPTLAATGNGSRFARRTHIHVALDSLTSAFLLAGHIAPNAVDTLVVVYPNQHTAYMMALGDALTERGITVAGQPASATAPIDTLFTYRSPALREILRLLYKPSQNQIAEILLKTIGLERTGVGSADSGRRVVRDSLLAWGALRDGFQLRDGSGLSRYDYLSPTTIVHILATMRMRPTFPVFYDALPVAGTDGTLESRMRGTLAQGNAHAKTGSISNARSLSGYVRTSDGRLLLFSLLCNNWTVRASDVLHVQDVITERLAALTLGASH